MKFEDVRPRFALVALGLLFGSTAVRAQLPAVSPNSLAYTYQIGGQNPPQQYLYTSDMGTPTQFVVDQTAAQWLTITNAQTGALITPDTRITAGVALTVAVAYPTPTAPQNGVIVFRPPLSVDSSGVSIPVTLTVLPAAQGNLTASPNSLSFSYQVGGPTTLSQALNVQSTGNSVEFSASASTQNGGQWLSAFTTRPTTPSTVTVSVAPFSTMLPGTYNGTVSLIPSAGGTPVTVPVTLHVSSSGTLIASPTALAFTYQSGSLAPSPQNLSIANSLGGSTGYFLTAVTSSGGNWLTFSPSSGNTPSSVLVSVHPTSLASGTYFGTINVNPSTGTATATQIPVTLTVLVTAQLLASPTSLTFNYQAGGPRPPQQYISLSSTGGPITFSASTTGVSWLTLSPSTGTTPSALTVTVNPPSGVAPGTYNASINVNSPTNTAFVAVPVIIIVTSPNYLTVSPSQVSLNYTIGGQSPSPAVIYITSTGGSTRYDAVAATSGFSPWLQVSPTSGYTPASVVVTISPQGLTPGTYSGSISIVADGTANSPQTIAVTLTVTKAPTLTAVPFGLVFSYQIGQSLPSNQVAVISSGTVPFAFGVSRTTTSGGNWLLAVGAGTTPATIAAAVMPENLAPGTYLGTINIQPADPTVFPLQIPVILNVAGGPVLLPSTNQLSFQYQTNGTLPAAQRVTIASSSAAPIVFYPTFVTEDGGQWLTATPSVAATSSDLVVTVNPQGLAAGYYSGVIILNDTAGTAPASYVPITLQISDTPILTVSGQPLSFTAAAGSIAPAQQILVGGSSLGRVSAYHVVTYGGAWLKVNPVDGFTDSSLSVVASAQGLGSGYYLGLVSIGIPGSPGSQQSVPVVLVVP